MKSRKPGDKKCAKSSLQIYWSVADPMLFPRSNLSKQSWHNFMFNLFAKICSLRSSVVEINWIRPKKTLTKLCNLFLWNIGSDPFQEVWIRNSGPDPQHWTFVLVSYDTYILNISWFLWELDDVWARWRRDSNCPIGTMQMMNLEFADTYCYFKTAKSRPNAAKFRFGIF